MSDRETIKLTSTDEQIIREISEEVALYFGVPPEEVPSESIVSWCIRAEHARIMAARQYINTER